MLPSVLRSDVVRKVYMLRVISLLYPGIDFGDKRQIDRHMIGIVCAAGAGGIRSETRHARHRNEVCCCYLIYFLFFLLEF